MLLGVKLFIKYGKNKSNFHENHLTGLISRVSQYIILGLDDVTVGKQLKLSKEATLTD
jgi:hypothetical protein